jgi:hypothetical protein
MRQFVIERRQREKMPTFVLRREQGSKKAVRVVLPDRFFAELEGIAQVTSS